MYSGMKVVRRRQINVIDSEVSCIDTPEGHPRRDYQGHKGLLRWLSDIVSPVGGHVIGGCLRDWYWGRENLVKDYDVFFPSSADTEKALDVFVGTPIIEVPTINMREEVVRAFKAPSMKVDLIFTNQSSIREVVGSFDSSICQIWIEAEGGTPIVYCTADFLRYKFGFWCRYMRISTGGTHLERLRVKYGPYKTVYKQEMEVVRLGPLSDLEPHYAPIFSV